MLLVLCLVACAAGFETPPSQYQYIEPRVVHMSANANGFRPNAAFNSPPAHQHAHYWDGGSQRHNCTTEDGTILPPEDGPREVLTTKAPNQAPLAPPEKITSKSDSQTAGSDRDLDIEHAKLVQDINGLFEQIPTSRKSIREKYSRPAGSKFPTHINDYIEGDPLALGAEPDEFKELEYDALSKPAAGLFQTKAPHRFRRPMRHLSVHVRPIPNVKTTEATTAKSRVPSKPAQHQRSKHPYTFVRHQPGDLIIVARPQKNWNAPVVTTLANEVQLASQKGAARPAQAARPNQQGNQLRQQTEQVFQTERPFKRPVTLWQHLLHLFV